jgi:multimeric flavodoxin WrbA
MKKVLGIIGSPRKKGNTHLLVEKVLEGAQDAGALTEPLLLGDLAIRECDGCHVCWNQKPCSKKDDMIDVYYKIEQSDIIVFGTPVYWYGPTALMKCLIDRFVFFNCPENRKSIQGKGAILVIPFEEEDRQTVEPLLTFFEKSLSYLEMTIMGRIIVPGVTKRGEVIKKVSIMNDAFQLGKKSVQEESHTRVME